MNGKPTYAELLAQNERFRNALDGLLESSERYRAIVESSEDAIISKDLNGIINSWNAGAERLFGWTEKEMLGRSVRLLIPKEMQAEEDEIIGRIRRGVRIEHYETVRQRKDGSRLDISLTISPIKDPEGKVIGASKVARDITARKEAETELKEADRRKDEFLATLAHELRSPLAPLSNALQLLEIASNDPSIAAQARAMMDRQLQLMVRLVDDLMDLSRVSRGAVDLRRARLDLRTALVQAVEGARPLVDAQGHRLNLILAPEPLWVEGDAARLAQVFNNLLNNAAKFTDPGGTITVESRSSNGRAVVSVRDTGIGIEAAHRDKVFDMFVQLTPASTRRHTGLGIGLSIVRRLVQMHDGSIEVSSEGPGTGSTFTVDLPMITVRPEEHHPQDARTEEDSKLRVLVTDDNVDTAVTLCQLLQRLGHDARAAHNAADALVEVQRFAPQVTFMDIGMPEVDGYEACRRIRATPTGRNVFMVALTGWGQDRDKQLATEAGFDMHLVKPLVREEMMRALRQARLRVATRGNGGLTERKLV